MRAWGRFVLAAFFAFLAVNAWLQVVGNDPVALAIWQAAIGLAAAIAAWGAWSRAAWAAAASMSWGILTAGMLVALPWLVDIEEDGRAGVWIGAAAVLLIGATVAWLQRRSQRRTASVGAQG